ncbi:MAG: hypothetical protein HYX87_09510 [Chloroflexi bacterium]|nr:hypothetical protein [Chloroflexota bacterium]
MLLKEYAGKTLAFSTNGDKKEVSYITRVDPLSGTVAKISEERAKRGFGIVANLDLHPIKDCPFCNYEQYTPKERIYHSNGAVSVPNKFPWEKLDWITIYPPFGEHKLLLSDLYFEDMERMIESSYDLALMCSKDPEVIAFMDFTNWGTFAGASQQHPHSQRRSITFVPDPRQEQEWRTCRELYQKYGRNPFDLLSEEERLDGRRVIHDGSVLIASAFAPTCTHEIIVYPHEPISHILQTHNGSRAAMMRPVLGIFPALFFYRGITDLNIAVHMAPFRQMEEARKYYRWHMHIYPRKSRLPMDRAGAEIGFETNVIEALPESTASALRQWYIERPRPDLVAKREDGSPNPKLMDEFNKIMAVCR